MGKRRFTSTAIVVLLTALGLVLGFGNYCLNAWNGGPYVRTYYAGVANDAFETQGVDRCNNGDYSTAGCPGKGDPAGRYIFQIQDTNTGACVGNSPSNGNLGYLDKCNGTSYPGSGGANGTLFLQKQAPNGSNCFIGGYTYYINNYWTNQNGGWSGAVGLFWSPDADGSYAELSGASPTCLG